MIILYGSYARDMYVDCDRRRDYGVTTFFMSDYDILIVTRRRLGLKEYDVYARITERFFENKQSEFYTRPQFINESISRLNKNLELGQYFYHEIKKQGIMLYSSQEFKLARCRKLNYAEIAKIARDYFNEKFQFASDFLLGARYYAGLQKYKMASFHLHQAAENYLRTIPLVYILYGYKDHALEILMDRCKTHTLQLVSVFPRNTEEERRLFNLLQDAYVQARYNKDFVVTKTDIDALIPRLELMRDITEKSLLRPDRLLRTTKLTHR